MTMSMLARSARVARVAALATLLGACGDAATPATDRDTTTAVTDTVTADALPDADAAADTAPGDTAGAADTRTDATPDGADDTAAPADTTSATSLRADYPLASDQAYPESVTWDPIGRAFFTGSMALGNVTRIAADGTESELFPGNAEGEWLVLGLEADPARRRLWVCAGKTRALTGSELWLLDLDTGERLWRVDLDTVQPGGVCIDVVVTSDGAAYIADRAFPNVYRVDPQAQSLTTFATNPALTPGAVGANGIAVDAQERFLVVAKFLPPELVRIKLSAPLDVAAVDLLNDTDDSFTGGVDGVTILDGAAYLALDHQIVRAVPDPSWTYATLAFRDLSLPNGDPVTGVSGITTAEGTLYLSQSDVTRFAIGTPPNLPFHVFRVDPAVFDAP